MQKTQTFTNFQVLKVTQETVQEELGDKYLEKIAPFVFIIEKVMKAKNIVALEAMKVIKEELPIYKQEHAPLFFSAALVEIIEESHFIGFSRR